MEIQEFKSFICEGEIDHCFYSVICGDQVEDHLSLNVPIDKLDEFVELVEAGEICGCVLKRTFVTVEVRDILLGHGIDLKELRLTIDPVNVIFEDWELNAKSWK